ncbi:organic solute transporter subunit beta [Perognathus longimembris pacificus]|uniref:organic solute transporter subunit beta n=1 Tax=Perognathus longimembris pacificus TaxID=214514 RepID=UPI002019F41F|nr:organic solute transporter subunit beta [Perognathus longimembris pacificus]
MEHQEEAMAAPAGTAVPQELLEEMVWLFRVEDASPWNYSMLALTALVVVISMFLLARNIQANRQQKRQPPEKETPEAQQLDDFGAKANSSLNYHLPETWISGKPNLAPGSTFEAGEREGSLALLPDAAESQS